MFKNIHVLIGIGAAMTGCALEQNEEVTRSSVVVDDTCTEIICPGNSNLIGLLGPYELDETAGQLSRRGYRIGDMGLYEDHDVTHLFVKGASLEVRTRAGKTVTGSDLVGLKLTLQRWEENVAVESFEMRIAEYRPGKVSYYTGGPLEIEAFKLEYGKAGVWTELCPFSDVEEDFVGSWAVFWKGDRIDPDRGRIFASNRAVGPWFNISCNGEAPIKMLRARTGGAVAPNSSIAQRQATLNMFTASYCGPGGLADRYTQLGQAIEWADLSGPRQIGRVTTTEAIWNEHGALCLNTPRLVHREEVRCAPDPCSPSMIANWSQYGLLVTGNK